MKYLFLVILLLLIVSCNNNNEVINTPLVAYIKVDKTKTTVGDTINATLVIDKDKNIKENILNIKKAFRDFILYEETKLNPKYVNDRIVIEFKYKLQVPKKGTYIIEPIEIEYIVPRDLENIFGKSSKTKTSKIFIDVKTNLTKEDENTDIEDIKPIVKIFYISKNILIITIICLLLSILIILFVIKVLHKKQSKIPYYKVALEELKNINYDNIKTSYFLLSNVIRKFIDQEFELKTLEKTTQEIEELIKNTEIKNKKELIILLNNIDIYKYTKIESNKEQLSYFVNKAIEFINLNIKQEENAK